MYLGQWFKRCRELESINIDHYESFEFECKLDSWMVQNELAYANTFVAHKSMASHSGFLILVKSTS